MPLRIRFILPILIIFVGVFLRFYKFGEFATFLGDQGRDAIIIKRIISLEHFPAIGAPSSLGQIFLGPFYYYLVSPFLLLFNFNPLGLAFGVALISLIGIVLACMLVKKEAGYSASLLFLTFAVFSVVNIQASRFSWNPNLLPIFSFFAVYFFSKSLQTGNRLFPVLFGAFLAFSIQLHHLAFLLFPPVLLVAGYFFWLNKKDFIKNQSYKIIFSLISFIFFYLPLIIFDLRHDFLNTRNLVLFFSQGNPTNHEQFLIRFLETNKAFYGHVFQSNVNPYISLALTFLILIFSVRRIKPEKNPFLFTNLITFIAYLILFSFFNTTRIPHYYNSVYFSFFLILSWVLSDFAKKGYLKFFILFIVAAIYFFVNVKSLSYIFMNKGSNQIKNAEKIADSILAKNPKNPYQTVALPYVETDGHVRYFLEIKGEKPLPSDTLADPRELYVLCFEKDPSAPDGGCRVLGNAQWQIAAFKNAKIQNKWLVEGVIIYKLIHK